MSASFPRHPIVVNAPSFDEYSGGVIALHYLVDRLRQFGADAYIFPVVPEPRVTKADRVPALGRLNRWRKKHSQTREALANFVIHDSMHAPIASTATISRSIVVYPEIIPGNPLRSERVVRWLLNRPGVMGPKVEFGKDDLLFYFQDAFRVDSLGIDPANKLHVRWIRDDIYFDWGLPGREGTCRLIRKGRLSGLDDYPDDGSILIDDMTHEQKAEVFNRTRVLYSHDAYTMYCFYAALCGCIPVVLPQPGKTRETWRPNEVDRYGVAYGEEDLDWAIATRPLLIQHFLKERQTEKKMIERFLRTLAARFP